MNAAPAIESIPEGSRRHEISSAAFQSLVVSLAVSQVALAFAIWRGWVWVAVPLVLVTAHFMHGLLIGFHEASHGLLRRSKALNEIDGVLIGIFSFLPFSLYRVLHQSHHMHLATKRDEEFWPLVNPEVPRWKRCVSAFFELTFGLFYPPIIFLRAFLRRGSRVRSAKVRRRIWAELALTVAVWGGILAAVTALNAWRSFLWIYAAPAFVAGNLQSWRKYIEHVGMTGDTVNGCTRSIVPRSPLGKLVAVTLLHEPLHGIHHQHAGLPHTVLPEYTALLEPKHPGERAPFISYREALPEVLRSLADPRFGPQWQGRANQRA
jgi:fatty acid desaturase